MSLIAVIGGLITILLLIAIRPKKGSREARLVNTAETEFLGLEEAAGRAVLAGTGGFVVKTFRQSGNPHQADRQFNDASKAISAAVSTLRRSKIDQVVVMTNSDTEFAIRRAWHDHRGSSEGKKVGWIEVHRVTRGE